MSHKLGQNDRILTGQLAYQIAARLNNLYVAWAQTGQVIPAPKGNSTDFALERIFQEEKVSQKETGETYANISSCNWSTLALPSPLMNSQRGTGQKTRDFSCTVHIRQYGVLHR
jgi:hypothetical protein